MQNASDFKLMDRRVAESILSMPERNMFFRATSSWVGFKTISVSFEVREREPESPNGLPGPWSNMHLRILWPLQQCPYSL